MRISRPTLNKMKQKFLSRIKEKGRERMRNFREDPELTELEVTQKLQATRSEFSRLKNAINSASTRQELRTITQNWTS